MNSKHDHLIPRDGPSAREVVGLVLVVGALLWFVAIGISSAIELLAALALGVLGSALMFTKRVVARMRRDRDRGFDGEDAAPARGASRGGRDHDGDGVDGD